MRALALLALLSPLAAAQTESPEPVSPLQWLALHQGEDGMWDADAFDAACSSGGLLQAKEEPGAHPHWSCGGLARSGASDLRATGLALLAFTGAGNTYRSGVHKLTVKHAVKALVRGRVYGDGPFYAWADPADIEGHAVATSALVEMFALSGKSPLIKKETVGALDRLIALRNNDGSWGRRWPWDSREQLRATFFAALAMKSAQVAGLLELEEHTPPTLEWIRRQRMEAMGAAERTPGEQAFRLALCFQVQLWLGNPKKSDLEFQRGLEELRTLLPRLQERMDTVDAETMYVCRLMTIAAAPPREDDRKPLWQEWDERIVPLWEARWQLEPAPARGSLRGDGGNFGRIEETAFGVLHDQIQVSRHRVFR